MGDTNSETVMKETTTANKEQIADSGQCSSSYDEDHRQTYKSLLDTRDQL